MDCSSSILLNNKNKNLMIVTNDTMRLFAVKLCFLPLNCVFLPLNCVFCR